MCVYTDDKFLGSVEARVEAYFLFVSGIEFLQGQFIGVVGKVGSGKSSLLAAITAEMNIIEGEVCVSHVINVWS